jgi:hypothetical protein
MEYAPDGTLGVHPLHTTIIHSSNQAYGSLPLAQPMGSSLLVICKCNVRRLLYYVGIRGCV